ncbi:MAG TPA: hypothetical protein VK624_22425 [Steroidobacteraceae bacterium]|nr:hypothetical protein [Steroidobacteraceae bacterium]
MRKSTILMLVIMLAGAASAATLWQQLRVERDTNAALHARLTALEHDSAAVATSVSKPAVPLPAEPDVPRAMKTVAEPPSAPSPPAAQFDYMRQQQQLLKNPDYRKALRDQRRQYLEFSFRDLAKVLNLTPEKAAAVFDLMADQFVESMNLRWQAQRPAGNAVGRDLQRVAEERQRKADEDMERLLGAANMTRLQEFRETLSSRTEVNMLRNELSAGPDPLRDDQYQPLLDIVHAEEQQMNRELQELYAGDPTASGKSHDTIQTELAVAANRRIVEAAKSILTSEQLATVQNVYRRQRAQMETQNTLSRLQMEARIRDARDQR